MSGHGGAPDGFRSESGAFAMPQAVPARSWQRRAGRGHHPARQRELRPCRRAPAGERRGLRGIRPFKRNRSDSRQQARMRPPATATKSRASKPRGSCAAETQSVIDFPSPSHFPNLRDHVCPTATFTLSARPDATTRNGGQMCPCRAHASNPSC